MLAQLLRRGGGLLRGAAAGPADAVAGRFAAAGGLEGQSVVPRACSATRGFSAAADEGGEGGGDAPAPAADDGGVTLAPRKARGLRLKKPKAADRAKYKAYMDSELSNGPRITGVDNVYNLESIIDKVYPMGIGIDDAKALDMDNQANRELYDILKQVLPPDEFNPDADKPKEGYILKWTTQFMMEAGPGGHPCQKKAKVQVKLNDLKEYYELSDAGAKYIAALCGARYNTRAKEITLVSQEYPTSEDNRRRLMEIIQDLVEEGRNPPEGLDAYLEEAGAHAYGGRKKKMLARAPPRPPARVLGSDEAAPTPNWAPWGRGTPDKQKAPAAKAPATQEA